MTGASRAQCSAMCRPGTEVAMARVGPCVSAPGLGSNVSNWLGPPAIHNRMQARFWRFSSLAKEGSGRTRPAPARAAPASRKRRRVTPPRASTWRATAECGRAAMRSPLGQELGGVDQRPEDVLERLVAVAHAGDVAAAHRLLGLGGPA